MEKHYWHYEKCNQPKYIFYEIVFIFVQNVSKYIFFMSTSFLFVHLKIYNNKYSLLQMKTSYLIFLEMLQILATYHYQILLLDDLRKSPLVKSSLSQRSLSQALCMSVSLFRKHQQLEAMTQNQPLRQHLNIQAAHHLATYHSLSPKVNQQAHLLQTVYSLQNALQQSHSLKVR